jgi:hypothetical protein
MTTEEAQTIADKVNLRNELQEFREFLDTIIALDPEPVAEVTIRVFLPTKSGGVKPKTTRMSITGGGGTDPKTRVAWTMIVDGSIMMEEQMKVLDAELAAL